MFHEIFKKGIAQVAMPLFRRLASNVSTALAVIGATQAQMEAVEAVMLLALGWAVDLVLSNLNRQHLKGGV